MGFCLNEFKISYIASQNHYNNIIIYLDVCKLIVCWQDQIGLSSCYLYIACHMFMHFPCIRILFSIYFDIFELVGTFLIISLSLPLFSFTLVISVALKHKSAPSQNPLRSRASTSSNPTPSHIQFRDEDACKAFSENFSRRGIHFER